MALKKYKLNPRSNQFIHGGDDFMFKIRFTRMEGEVTVYVSPKNGPLVIVPRNGVVSSTSDEVQRQLAAYMVPTITKRNGQGYEPGLMFDDITGGPQPVDVDLDEILV